MTTDVTALLACGAAGVQAAAGFARPGRPAWWQSRWIFTLLLATGLFLGQRDALRANFQIWNPDESQMIAGAMVLAERPVFWRDVDGTTHGPLAQYPLLIPGLVGARLDYTSARCVGLGLVVLLLFATQRTLATWLEENTARLLVLPAWAWLTLNQDPEIAQYTSELTPALLLGLAAWPACRLLSGSAPSPLTCAVCGLAAGAAPFAKLQAAPLAAWIVGFTLLFLLRTTGSARLRLSASLLAGAVVPVIVLVAPLVVAGAWDDFWIRYLVVNLRGYVAEGFAWFNSAPPSPGLIFGFNAFLWPTLGAIIAAGAWAAWRRARLPLGVLGFSLGLAACATFAIYAPRKPFGHYFLLGIVPLVLLLGAVAAPWLQRARETSAPFRALLAAVLLLALSGPVVLHHFRHLGYFRAVVAARPPLARELIEAVQRHTTPGGSLAVWGWQPGLYVFTQTLSATPDLIVFWQIVPSPWRDAYRNRYLRDFAARPPAVFVDTTGPSDFFFFQRVEEARHDAFPALREIIARDYRLVETVRDARVYLRNDSAVRSAGGL